MPCTASQSSDPRPARSFIVTPASEDSMAQLKDLIEKNDPKNEKFESVKTSLDLLDKLTNYKLDELNEKIKAQLEDKAKFKTTHQDKTDQGTHVTVTEDADNITKALDGIIGGFCAGSSEGTRKAVSGIVGTVLTALLGAAAGHESYKLSYTAIAEDEILKRLDVAYWSYGIEAKGITEKKQTALAYVCVKSYIDAKDVHATELVSMYREAARLAGKPEDAKAILAALEEAQTVLKAMQADPVLAMEHHKRVMASRLSAV
jgi:hypothetical protein